MQNGKKLYFTIYDVTSSQKVWLINIIQNQKQKKWNQ